MGNSGIGPAGLLAVVLAGGLAMHAGIGDWSTSLTGLTLLMVLFAYDNKGERSFFQSVAFAAVCGFCLMLISVYVLPYLSVAVKWLPVVWMAGTVLFLIIDRMRVDQPVSMGTREAAAPPVAAAVPKRPGKEVSIFVALVGEGMSVLRPVRAQDMGHNYYQILEEMPEGETWEFKTGQVVRGQKKNLSSGKGLVAVEEAPRG